MLLSIGVLSWIVTTFKVIRQFKRAAVLCDKQWVQTISELEGKLIPGLSIKAFDMDQADQAEQWLNS